jgi:hypothetical protein
MKKIFLLLMIMCSSGYSQPIKKEYLNKSTEETAKLFIGKPYNYSPLGEGQNAETDTDPLYRFDTFNCTTYTETILALHFSKTPTEFKETINNIRYKDGKISFETRNHFIETDWIPNNKKYFIDITNTFPESKTKELSINKRTWMQKLFSVNPNTNIKDNIKAKIAYIPKDKITKEFIKKLPDNTIINIAKWNPQTNEKIHSEIFISHQGILINKKDFYHASYDNKKVEKQNFLEYIKYLKATSPSFQGINILKIK